MKSAAAERVSVWRSKEEGEELGWVGPVGGGSGTDPIAAEEQREGPSLDPTRRSSATQEDACYEEQEKGDPAGKSEGEETGRQG